MGVGFSWFFFLFAAVFSGLGWSKCSTTITLTHWRQLHLPVFLFAAFFGFVIRGALSWGRRVTIIADWAFLRDARAGYFNVWVGGVLMAKVLKPPPKSLWVLRLQAAVEPGHACKESSTVSAPLIPLPDSAALVHSRQRITMHGRPELPFSRIKRVVGVGPEGGREFLSVRFLVVVLWFFVGRSDGRNQHLGLRCWLMSRWYLFSWFIQSLCF